MEKRLPLFSELLNHLKKNPISFHVPGHKMGKGFNPVGKEIYQDLLSIDMTEIQGLDDLHRPDGVILESQQKAAEIFGSEQTFYLVNGTTSGNLAMIMATCNQGDKVIVQRNVHKSIINGLLLAKAIPVYINPEIIENLKVPGSIFINELEELLKLHDNIKAVIIMNPNYYGLGIDISKIADLVHNYNIPLLVDEAHGAHFGFHQAFPKSSTHMGADIVVQSTHKTLSAMTMGSMLHVNSKLIDIERLKLFLSIFQSSSPSYPIMASLELTTDWLEAKGPELWDQQLIAVENLLTESINIENLKIITEVDNRYYKDPLKLIIQSKNSYITGFEIQSLLQQEEIYPELADFYNVLLIISLGNDYQEIMRLKEAIRNIDTKLNNLTISKGNRPDIDFGKYYRNNKGNLVPLEKVLYSSSKKVPFTNSIGAISAEMVIPYPPGIPILIMGEEITKEIIDYILALKENGVTFHGVKDRKLEYIEVFEQ